MQKNIYFFLALLVVSSCSPLVTLHQKDMLVQNPVCSIETPELTIYMEHMGNQYGHMVFDLEIINHTQSPIEFTPQSVSYYASPKMFEEPAKNSDLHAACFKNSQLIMKRLFARSEESMNALIKQQLKDRAVLSGIFLVLSATAIVADAAKDVKDYNKENYTQADYTNSVKRDALVATTLLTANAVENSRIRASEESYYLEYEFFKEGVIEPESRRRGKIFLPIDTNFRYTRIVVPIANTDYVLDFKRHAAKAILVK